MDQRTRDLGGEPKWVRSNLQLFSKPSGLTSHDWLTTMEWAHEYIFNGAYDDGSDKIKVLFALLDAIKACLLATSAVDSESRDDLDKLKLKVVEALVGCEGLFPESELPVMLHVLLHVPDAIYRWNSPRNFWSYFGERYVFTTVCYHYVNVCALC